ncbi:helix-turn-helix domain-containing protein [Streptomyces sp. NPDC023998]|uniref:winged helix-turn-helix transcriptional regulator n=1 Tax=Streptomyces sp. NPDC023998 TaxID=3154597 RepID=UPI0033FAB824
MSTPKDQPHRGPWTGYGRFCPLARALDVVGERWSLVIIQELLKQPCRYGELQNRLPGIGTSVLADRLRRLERAGVVARTPGAVGAGVLYTLTERGQGLDEALRALRRWGVGFLADPTADGSHRQYFDVTYVDGIDTVADGHFRLVVDDRPTTLRFAAGELSMEPGEAEDAELIVRTSAEFLDRWAAGEADWDDGRARGEVSLEGPATSWPRWLAATGYLLHVEPVEPLEPETTDV